MILRKISGSSTAYEWLTAWATRAARDDRIGQNLGHIVHPRIVRHRWPIASVQVARRRTPRLHPGGRFRHRASVTTVLIVDDEPNIRTLIEQALEDLTDEGVEIVTAADGDEASRSSAPSSRASSSST